MFNSLRRTTPGYSGSPSAGNFSRVPSIAISNVTSEPSSSPSSRSVILQGPPEDRRHPGRPPEEDPEQRPVHPISDGPVTNFHSMTAGGAVGDFLSNGARLVGDGHHDLMSRNATLALWTVTFSGFHWTIAIG